MSQNSLSKSSNFSVQKFNGKPKKIGKLHLIELQRPDGIYYMPAFKQISKIRGRQADPVVTFSFGPVTLIGVGPVKIRRYTASTNYTDFSVRDNGAITYKGSELTGYEYSVCITSSSNAEVGIIRIDNNLTTEKDGYWYMDFIGVNDCTYQFIYLNPGNQITLSLSNGKSPSYNTTNIVSGTVSFTFKQSTLFSYSNLYVPVSETVTITQYDNQIASPDFTVDSNGVITFHGPKSSNFTYSICDSPSYNRDPSNVRYSIFVKITSNESTSTIVIPMEDFNASCHHESITLNSGDQIITQIQNQSKGYDASITCNGRISFISNK